MYTLLILFILPFYSSYGYSYPVINKENEFTKEIGFPKYKNYTQYISYIDNSQIGQFAKTDQIFQYEVDTLKACGKKYKHLQSKDFQLATQDCYYKWKVYYHYEECKEDKSCDDIFDFEMQKKIKSAIIVNKLMERYKK